MERFKKAGWSNEDNKKEGKTISEEDIKKAFRKMDMDKSGNISKRVRSTSVQEAILLPDQQTFRLAYICNGPFLKKIKINCLT